MTNAQKSAKAIFDGSTGGGTDRRLPPPGPRAVVLPRSARPPLGAHGRARVRGGPAGEVFRLGHPLTIRLTPIYGAIGYRFLPELALRALRHGGRGCDGVQGDERRGRPHRDARARRRSPGTAPSASITSPAPAPRRRGGLFHGAQHDRRVRGVEGLRREGRGRADTCSRVSPSGRARLSTLRQRTAAPALATTRRVASGG